MPERHWCLDETVLSTGLDLEIDALGDAEAARWYRLAAEQGHAAAQSRLGDFYQFGYGVQRDYADAVRWHRAAAEQGGVVAQYNLGVRYARGHGVLQDDVEAVRWYRLAAEQGFAAAQNNLALMYAEGRGVVQDYVQAHMWWTLAVSRLTGEERKMSADDRDALARLMTPAQIAEAQRLAREWDAAHPREP
uniref:FOG: TPR repeat, SEL1 subfamily n=1 Tax=uncultured gamma proteobacterium HF4000_48E10 TaxID=723583 RepID=E7C8R0_9GAMM|nr:FOG: TPR repeat, SEL1 subfamily [uncultured gamma proteobacterium HF4000_48E10]